jgi:multimeric flavodoxin WrbA
MTTKDGIHEGENGKQAPTPGWRLMLVCGILASVLYLAMNIFVPMRWEEYSSASQTISELSAIGAPTRPLWVLLGHAFTLLAMAFGAGVWATGRGSRLRVAGALIAVFGATGIVWPFVPMHLRGAGTSLTDILHLVVGGVNVLLMLLAIGFGATALGKPFRLFSIASLVVFIVSGVFTGIDSPRIPVDLPTPWLGVWERLGLGVFLLWIVVLAVALLRQTNQSRQDQPKPKRVTVLVGSGRKQRGATHAAARQLLDHLESYGDVHGEIVYLSEHELGLCRGCKVCFLRGEEHCPLEGDRDLLIEKILSSDGVVLASPNYSFQVSAITKAFLDRLGFAFHRPRFFGKTFSGLVVQGLYGGAKIERYLAFVGAGLGFNVVKGSCITALEPMTDNERRTMERATARQARRVHDRLLASPQAAPSLLRLMAFRMGRTAIKQQLRDGDRDHDYYRDRGWFESDYYYPTRLGPFKKVLGAVFDSVAARVYGRSNGRRRPSGPTPATPQSRIHEMTRNTRTNSAGIAAATAPIIGHLRSPRSRAI